ncbi:MAG: adenosylcobinamide amidohydrolase [Candidatus Rokubacteria bacterium]|nr:adenosylcobinamide amidohydrolase [Candidatus Rokubacteria bacterium]
MEGVTVVIGREAVVVTSAAPLTVLSSAVVSGGFARARAVINLHVGKDDPCADPEGMLARYAGRAGVPAPHVGLLTGAPTEHATTASVSAHGFEALALATVGLSNRMAAGAIETPLVWMPSTINTIVVVDADPGPAALVNAVMTVTEVKALALARAGVAAGFDGERATGTSTDAVVIAATGRGPRVRFAGPASELGWTMARAALAALSAAVSGWLTRSAP